MSHSVEVDSEVWEHLKARAEPFVDTSNSVLRRLLGLADAGPGQEGPSQRRHHQSRNRSSVPRAAARSRAPLGSLLPEVEYEMPILRVLAKNGGAAPAREVVGTVGKLVGERLTELDREELPNGGRRWENRIQFTRLRLKERGLIKGGSPRGL